MADSELGKIPEGWEVKPLDQVMELAYGKGLKQDDRKHGPVPVYGSSGVVGYHDEALVDGPGIIVGRKGNVGSVHWAESDFYPIDTVYYVKTSLPLQYVYYNLHEQNFINSDAAVPGLSRKQAYLLPFLIPDELALNIFSKQIEVLFDTTSNLRKRNNILRHTRDLLLPKLISGDLDVSDLDIEIPMIIGDGVSDTTYETTNTQTTTSGDTNIEKGEDSPDTPTEEETKTGDQEIQDTTQIKPPPIDEWETEEIMATFRKAARGHSVIERDELISEVVQLLGYRRPGPHIRDVLKGHLRAAIRRHIIGADGTAVWLETPKAKDYERDELIDTMISVMRKNREYDREDVIYAVVRHLGFKRMIETVTSPIRSAINGAIRRGILGYQGNTIWRED